MNHTASSTASPPHFGYTAVDCDPDLSHPSHQHHRATVIGALGVLSACIAAAMRRIAAQHRP